jgi:hypothetical protein
MFGMVAVYASAGDTGSPSGSQTELFDLRSSAMGGIAGYQLAVAAGSHSFPWTLNAGCGASASSLIALRAAVTP